MNRNVVTVLLIFLVPVISYWALTKDKTFAVMPSIATTGPEIIKFSSPMCYECQELDKNIKEVYPKYSSKITLTKVDVTQKDKNTAKLIREYNVKLVPTCIFKNKNGDVTRVIEGDIQPKILENYMKEQLNG